MPLPAAKQEGACVSSSAGDDGRQSALPQATSAGEWEDKSGPLRIESAGGSLCEGLQSICMALTAAKTEDDVWRIVLDDGLAKMHLLNIAFWRLQNGWLVMQGSRGYSSEFAKAHERLPLTSTLPIASVARSGEPIWFASMAEHARAPAPGETASAPEGSLLVASACLPLTVDGRTSGGIALSFRRRPDLSDEERRLLVLLAAQCSHALEHARLFEAERRMRSRIGRMQDVTAAFSRASTAQEVAEVACRIGGEAVEARSATLWTARADGTLALAGVWGSESSVIEHFRELSAAAIEPVRNAGAIWVETDDDYRRVLPESFERARAGGRLLAWGAIPLMPDDRIAGLICFGHPIGHRYDEGERSFCVALAQHCAQALDRARLLDAERRSNNRLRLLAAAGEAFSASMDYESTLRSVVGLATPLLADYCYFDIVDGDWIYRIADAHEDAQTASELRWPPRSRLDRLDVKVGALSTGQAAFYPYVDDGWMCEVATSAVNLDAMRRHALSSMITVPLLSAGVVIGALTLCYGKTKRHHAHEDLSLAQELGRRATIAIEQARLYRTAQDAARRAEEANRVKDEFLATVSHELRTPLNAISGWSSLLVQRMGEPAAAKKAVDVIRRNVRVQTQIVEDILDMSRIMTGKLKLDAEPIDMIAIVRDAIDVVRPAADAKRIAMSLVEPAPEQCLLVGDAQRLQQVAWNLLSNAVKFTDPGGRIHVFVEQEGAEIALKVADSGRGIDAGFLPHVFERFKQADGSTTREFGGLGLGLAIVQHIVELHGGRAFADSPGAGAGATFRIVLPVRAVLPRPIRDKVSTGSLSAEAQAAYRSLASLRILVVDDEPDARELIEEVLVSASGVVETAACVSGAVRALDLFRPHVIVTDLGMPGEDGYALLRAVRSRAENDGGAVPVVALTAYAHPEDRARTLIAGFNAHLPKPVDAQRLVVLVSKLGGA
jgi:signal transduction histidine kinase